MADHSDGMTVHLAHRDVTLVAVSRAPLTEIERFRRRMGWQFKWVSSHGSDFNYDSASASRPSRSPKARSTTTTALATHRRGMAWRQRLLPGWHGPGLSHLLHIRARGRGDDGHVQNARPHAQGPRREGRAPQDGMGASPRSLRADTPREGCAGGQCVLQARLASAACRVTRRCASRVPSTNVIPAPLGAEDRAGPGRDPCTSEPLAPCHFAAHAAAAEPSRLICDP